MEAILPAAAKELIQLGAIGILAFVSLFIAWVLWNASVKAQAAIVDAQEKRVADARAATAEIQEIARINEKLAEAVAERTKAIESMTVAIEKLSWVVNAMRDELKEARAEIHRWLERFARSGGNR